MIRLLLGIPLLLAAASCATSSTPYAPVRDPAYQALGGNPPWLLAIGDDRIVLRVRLDENGGTRDFSSFTFPRTLPRTQDGVRTWRSGDVTHILVEARRSPCTGVGGRVFEDSVRVRWSYTLLRPGEARNIVQELSGCGGRLLEVRAR
ncbi:MAG TPA: hypothetical protein VEC11_12755 [Allosphingosinicella sp.]|nr:hypothetical protein [Allosphingosinicella sp.]